jgi:hypothetical protein
MPAPQQIRDAVEKVRDLACHRRSFAAGWKA